MARYVNGRAVVVAEPIIEQRSLPPIDVLLIEIDDEWVAWSTGPHESWLPLDKGVGVVLKAFRVDPDATEVSFGDDRATVIEIGGVFVAHAAMWEVAVDSDCDWPTVDSVYIDGHHEDPVSPEHALTIEYLSSEYVAELVGKADWAWDAVADLVDRHAFSAIKVILAAVDHAHDEELLSRIGAGHLESLVRRHGQSLDEPLAAAAASSAAFRLALRSVWAPLPSLTAAAVGA